MEFAGFFEVELPGEIFQNDMVHGKPCINGFRNGPKPADADMQDISIDSTCIKAHKASAGAKKEKS